MTPDQLVFVRTLIDSGDPTLFTDDQITAVYTQTQSTWLTGAVLAERIAADMVLLSRKITTQDLSTDGPAMAEALRKLAATWRQHAAQESGAESWGVATWPGPGSAYSRPELTEWPATVTPGWPY